MRATKKTKTKPKKRKMPAVVDCGHCGGRHLGAANREVCHRTSPIRDEGCRSCAKKSRW